MIRFYFVLVNEYGSVVTGNGQASLKITDNLNNILYSEDFGFSSSDFVDYEYSLTGQKIGKAFQWKVPFSDIKKGFATYGQGKANLKLELSDGRIFTDDTSVEIPTYTEEEIMELYGNKYLEKSISIDKTIRKSSNYGDFEVTVVRAGEFTHLKYGTWGDEVTHFRIDIKVRNVGSEKGTFYGHDAVILDNSGNQYENNYFDDKFDGGDIYPDVTKGGYLIFDELKKKPDSVKLIIENGWELSDDYKMIPITYEFNIKFEWSS